MSLAYSKTLLEQGKLVHGLGPVVPSTSTPDYVSLKGYHRCFIYIQGLNGTTVTGSAITVHQATAVAGTSEKAVAISTAFRNADAAASDTWVSFAVTSNTFTTVATNSLLYQYGIEITEDMLDVAGGFDCIRAGTANAVNTTVAVAYYLYPAKYGGASPVPSAILD